MSEQLPSRMSAELSLAGGEPVEVYDRAIGPAPGTYRLADLARFDALPPVLQGFLESLSANRLDADTILVFADWLEEHGRTEAGERVRLLRPQPGDVIAVWPASHTDDAHFEAGQICNDLAAGGCLTVLLCFGEDLAVADPDQLRAAGWVREEEAQERVRAEREACAELVERIGREIDGPGGLSAYQAASIRARGGSA